MYETPSGPKVIRLRRPGEDPLRVMEVTRQPSNQELETRIEAIADGKTNQNPNIQLITCSPETWARTQQRELTSYRLISVSSSGCSSEYHSSVERLFKEKAIELGCEVVVDVRITPHSGNYLRYLGTGMILQNDKQQTEKGEQ